MFHDCSSHLFGFSAIRLSWEYFCTGTVLAYRTRTAKRRYPKTGVLEIRIPRFPASDLYEYEFELQISRLKPDLLSPITRCAGEIPSARWSRVRGVGKYRYPGARVVKWGVVPQKSERMRFSVSPDARNPPPPSPLVLESSCGILCEQSPKPNGGWRPSTPGIKKE